MANLGYCARYSLVHGKNLHVVACVLRKDYHELPQIYELGERLGGYVTLNMVTSPEEHSV